MKWTVRGCAFVGPASTPIASTAASATATGQIRPGARRRPTGETLIRDASHSSEMPPGRRARLVGQRRQVRVSKQTTPGDQMFRRELEQATAPADVRLASGVEAGVARGQLRFDE